MAFPAGFERGDVHDDPAPRIGRLAEADDEYVARDAEIFDRAGESEAIRRNDADVGLAGDEAVRGEILGVDDRAGDVGGHLQVVGTALILALGPEANDEATGPATPLQEGQSVE